MGGTIYLCSNSSLCDVPGFKFNILYVVVNYALTFHCPAHKDAMNLTHGIKVLSERSQVDAIIQSENPVSELGLSNISNIVIGPVSPQKGRWLQKYPNFIMQDKLLRSKGVVEVVRSHELHMNKIIFHSVFYASSLLTTIVLLALVIALLMWFTVCKVPYDTSKANLVDYSGTSL